MHFLCVDLFVTFFVYRCYISERDKKLEQLSGRAIVLYGAGIHMALGENIDLTPENERKIWQQALETARGEQ